MAFVCPSTAQRVQAYGTVDELNATVGLVRMHTSGEPDVEAMMKRIQNDLFDLGADLCTPGDDASDQKTLRIQDTQISRLEREIDAMNGELSPLTSFVLPGGTPAGAYLHLVAHGLSAGRADGQRAPGAGAGQFPGAALPQSSG